MTGLDTTTRDLSAPAPKPMVAMPELGKHAMTISSKITTFGQPWPLAPLVSNRSTNGMGDLTRLEGWEDQSDPEPTLDLSAPPMLRTLWGWTWKAAALGIGGWLLVCLLAIGGR